MDCSGCGNREAYRVSCSSAGESCNACAPHQATFHFSDVFFQKPGFEEHIAHPEKAPQGVYVRSREHKAAVMRQLGLREVGDKVRGARDAYA